MKRVLIVILALLFVLCAGCTAKNDNGSPLPTQSAAPEVVITPEPTTDGLVPGPIEQSGSTTNTTPLVDEYGEIQATIGHGDHLSALVTYPKTGLVKADSVIAKWARALVDDADTEVLGFRKTDPEAEAELNIHYNSYLIDDKFAGIVELGEHMTSHDAHPEDIVMTFNIDIRSGILLDNSKLFAPARIPDLLKMLRTKLLALDSTLLQEDMDATWLAYPVLMEDGVSIHLPRGYLPSFLGRQEIHFTYDELKGILQLPEGDKADFSASPKVSPAEKTNPPTPSPAAEVEATPARPPLPLPDPVDLDITAPMVALTFDDGPSVTTPKILKLLEQYGGRATFCVIGNRVESKKDIIAQIVTQGSEIASHTWSHKKLTSLSLSAIREQLQYAQDAIIAAGAPKPQWLRPPYGSVNEDVSAVAAEFSYAVVNWSIDTEDWKTRDADITYERIMREVKDGSIILCHDLHTETGDAMERVIPALVEAGYQLVTVSELMWAKEVTVTMGKVYRHP